VVVQPNISFHKTQPAAGWGATHTLQTESKQLSQRVASRFHLESIHNSFCSAEDGTKVAYDDLKKELAMSKKQRNRLG
jgi:hypothetical protein